MLTNDAKFCLLSYVSQSVMYYSHYNCCGTSEASEQQHNQDLREKYIGYELGYLKDSNAAAHSDTGIS